ncbi:hypothetical protein SISSUDRAFT_219864 [Sistotremastrum suecicum HHB10207 ss-3]|uniref:Uncharacterized protein n=1 Tax=Sistotremastrum suecicum HHB10207 ss-3 TaxID=1314776 RepID=A0A166A660_9AGAM|nr:hypothetical protein SISSUDRAFT_219864 [Sistotremastrum suecicum HHB10207 ss-3]
MISVLDFLAAYPDVPGIDILNLRDRATALKTKIYGILLEETRTFKGPDSSNEELLSEWSWSLHNHVTSLGSHSLDWYRKNVEKILQYLAQLPAPAASSPIWATLAELSRATYIPQSSHRFLSESVLKRWRTGEEFNIASIQPEGRRLEYERSEVAEKLEASSKLGRVPIETSSAPFKLRFSRQPPIWEISVRSMIFQSLHYLHTGFGSSLKVGRL